MEESVTKRRINYLILFRFIIIVFLFGIVFVMNIRAKEGGIEIYLPYYYALAFFAALLNLVYILINRRIRAKNLFLFYQISLDLVTITGLVYLTGGISSTYPILYQLVIIYGVFFLRKLGGIYAASGSSILYGVLLDLEYLRVIPSFSGQLMDGVVTPSYVILRFCVYVLSFYVVAALSIFIVERERKTRKLLEEREEAFSNLDQLYRGIIESINTGIVTVDRKGRIKTFNQAAIAITGLDPAHVLNRPIQEIFEIAEVGKYQEVKYKRQDGKKVVLGLSFSALRDSQGEEIGGIILIQDLSELREMAETIEKNKRMAFVGQMASNLAHELRNPLMSLSGSIQMLRRSLSLKEEDERLINIAIRAKDRLEGVIRDFLFLSGQKERKIEKVDLNTLIAEQVETIKKDLALKDSINLNVHIPEGTIFIGNRDELRHLVYNLILNGIQAIGENGVVDILVGKEKLDGGEGIKLVVKDNGKGIPEEEIDRIFEPFYTTKEKGTGLGLAIVQMIVQTYRGKIHVDSSPGRGSVFTVRLPQGELGKGKDG